MDEDGSNLLDYTEFLQACGLRDNMWSWRMFNLLDKNFVGASSVVLSDDNGRQRLGILYLVLCKTGVLR